MKLYIHMKCSTCKLALSFLKDHSIELAPIDIVNHPPSLQELKMMLKYQKGNIKKLLNTSGLLYRELQLSSKLPSMSEEDVLKLLSENGMLIKRPFLLGKNIGLTGFKESEWKSTLE